MAPWQWTVAATVFLATYATSVCDAEDLTVILQRIKQNREAIETIECEFETIPVKSIGSGKKDNIADFPVKVHWLQSPRAVRWDASSDFASYSVRNLWKDGLRKSIVSTTTGAGKLVETGSFLGVADIEADDHSPWCAAGFNLQVHPMLPVHKFLTQEIPNIAVREVVFKGSKSIELTGTFNKLTKTVILVDPARNCAIRKITTYVPGTNENVRMDREATEFKEIKPGLYFPVQLEYRGRMPGGAEFFYRIQFRSVRINEVIDPSRFELKFHEGLHVVDKPNNRRYTVGTDETVLAGTIEPIPLSKDEQDALDAQRRWYQRLNYWLAIGASFLLLLVLALLVRRSRRSSSPGSPMDA